VFAITSWLYREASKSHSTYRKRADAIPLIDPKGGKDCT
jgi:hypothetical protein